MQYLLALLIVFFLLGGCQTELRLPGEVSPPGEHLNVGGNPDGMNVENWSGISRLSSENCNVGR